MYITSISIQNVRVVKSTSLRFRYPGEPTPLKGLSFPNVTLIVGNNGAGKSTILKSIALAALGRAAQKNTVNDMVRRPAKLAIIKADFLLTWQDFGGEIGSEPRPARQKVQIEERSRGFETLRANEKNSTWRLLYDQKSPAFFLIGYGATRRSISNSEERRGSFRRADRWERVAGLFEDGWALEAVHDWLPNLRFRNRGRYTQVWRYLSSLLPTGYAIDENALENDEVRIMRGDISVPLAAMSDGFKAFFGWVADVLKNVCFLCPASQKLEENRGIVIVDEIDLHLHPAWQSTIVPKLSAAFPKIQFIFTTHSPIVVSSVERANIWVCESVEGEAVAKQFDVGVHGLNADQILVTEYFGINTSRAQAKVRQLEKLVARAEQGDEGAADSFAKELVRSLEGSENEEVPKERRIAVRNKFRPK